ncbi:serine/threonine protein kinase [Candidatus Woesearchaeota archaeon]|nr:MAG: serine/threonine protein kinase [Candidatus Woesearchaeota archaeon]
MNPAVRPKLSQYTIEDFIGRGSWGQVWKARRITDGSTWALKVLDLTPEAEKQLAHRGLTVQAVWDKESLGGYTTTHTHLTHGFIDIDNGMQFLAEEYVNRFLSDYLRGHNIPDLNETVKIAEGIVSGLSILHKKVKRVHGDLKPDNIGYTHDGIVKLTDFGTSTIARYIDNTVRDNMGCLYTRAPECFREGSHPTERSDVWSFGSLLYRLFTGKYIFQDELDNAKDPARFYEQMDADIAQKVIKQKLQHVPKKFRNLLKRSLQYQSHERYADAEALQTDLDKVIEMLDSKKAAWNYTKRALLPTMGALAFGTLMYLAATHEPSKIEMPKVELVGPASDITTEPALEFTREYIELPRAVPQEDNGTARIVTNNKYVAYLMNTYMKTANQLDIQEIVTEEQFKLYMAYTTPEERQMTVRDYHPVAKAIEVALNKSQMVDGKIDLEDFCTIARVGENQWNQTRKAANSFEFGNYINAQRFAGNGNFNYPIIPEKEQEFIKTWLAHIE